MDGSDAKLNALRVILLFTGTALIFLALKRAKIAIIQKSVVDNHYQ
jgi:hypothetical protein